MPLKPKNKSDPTIEERVSNLEREYSTINKLYKIVQNLEKQITNGHFCKWNIEMGKIIEFRREQNIFRESLEKDLTQGKKEIQNLKLILNELKTGSDCNFSMLRVPSSTIICIYFNAFLYAPFIE